MKTCTACGESKPLDAYGWRYKDTPKAQIEAKCKPCRAAQNNRYNQRKREARDIKLYEETPMPCDSCWNNKNCQRECASYKTWEEYGV